MMQHTEESLNQDRKVVKIGGDTAELKMEVNKLRDLLEQRDAEIVKLKKQNAALMAKLKANKNKF